MPEDVKPAAAEGNRSRNGYLRPYRDYAEQFGMSERSVKRLVGLGKENGHPLPLDDPPSMVKWWSANMKQRVPEKIWRAAGPDAVMDLPPAVAKREKKVEHEILPALASSPAVDAGEDFVMPEGRGLEAELDRLEKLAATLSVNAHQPGKAKAYTDTVRQMVITSEKLRTEAEKMKRLLPKDMVEAILHEFHGPIEREMRLEYRAMCEVLGLPPSPEKEDLWNKEMDRLFSRFSETILAVA